MLRIPLPRGRVRIVRSRMTALTGVGAALLLVVAPSGAAAAADDDPALYPEVRAGGCPVVASAQGISAVVWKRPDLVMELPTGVTVPEAQACVDYSVKDAKAFASSPYPGETAVGLTPLASGLLSGQTGQEVSLPAYPAEASADYPGVPESKVEQPGFSLTARSTETSARSTARSGAENDQAGAGTTAASADTAVDPATKSARALAVSDTQPLTVGEVLKLGHLYSMAKAEVRADGRVIRASELRIGRTMVGDQVVEITPDGVRALGTTTPLPEADPSEQLEAAGVRVRYLAERKTPTGVLSAGVEVIAQQTDQDGAVSTVRLTVGRAFAAVAQPDSVPSAPGVPEIPLAPVDTESSGDPTVGASGSGGEAASGPVPEDAPLPAEAPKAGEDAPAPEVAAPAGLAGTVADMGVAGLYLVLVLGALAMLVSGTLLRLLGVRTR